MLDPPLGVGTVVAAAALALLLWPGRSRLPRSAAVREGRPATGAARPRWVPAPLRDAILGRRGATARSVGRGAVRRLLGCSAALVGTGVALRVAPWQLTIAGLLIGYTAWRLAARARTAARAERGCAALTAALRGVVRELRAGSPPRNAVSYASADATPEIRALLRSVALADTSRSDAPRHDFSALPTDVVEQLGQAWAVAASRGVPLAAVLAACIGDLDDRAGAARLRAQHVAGPAVSGYVLAALPIAGIAMGAGTGSHPMDVLVGSTLGGVLLVAGVALCCAGLLWTGRIVRGGDG
jgi:tight adherence protein B